MQFLISTVCLALTSAVVGNAYFQKKQFYPAVVYITKSNASMAVIYIQFFVIVFMIGKLLRKIFLGTLRAAEFEHLLERFWYALTETCLAFTVFRDDFNPRFVALFTVLLFLKSFHWLAEERVDFMERSPVLGWLFHIRVASLLTILGCLDYMLLMHAYNSTLARGPTVQLVFGFEYAILLTVVASTVIKYVLHAAEMRTDTPWENKAVFLLYTELVIGLIKVILYVLFVVIMAKIYALPMFVFRPMFFTIRNFKKALSDVIMSRRAIRNMNTLYPDATPEELRLSDNICIICREDMVNHSKKLPCGHIFHTTCLRSWFQRQQTCPTCRLNILRTQNPNAPTILRQEEQAAAAVAEQQANHVNLIVPPAAAAPVVLPTPLLNTDGVRAEGAPTNNSHGTSSNVPNFPAFPSPPPFIMPPPFTLIPYGVPPPPMPSDLTTLTDEELRAMEGAERQNVEARIKHLRNIQLLLDAAGILMSNYHMATAGCYAAPKNSQNSNNGNAAAPVNQMNTPMATATMPPDDGPSTSGVASSYMASAVKMEASVPTAASTNDTKVSSTSSQPNSYTKATNSSPTLTQPTSSQSKTSVNLQNDVTIEDIGGEEHEYQVKKNDAGVSSTSTLITNANNVNDQPENAELSELRKRRLKFLEERNLLTSTQGTGGEASTE